MITVRNQKTVQIPFDYKPLITGAYRPDEYLKETILDTILNSKSGKKSVEVELDGQLLDEQTMKDLIIACCSEIMDMDSEKIVKELFAKTLLHFDPNTTLSIQDLYLIQSATKANLPFPSANVIYMPATDVVPISKQFLTGACDYDTYFATMGFYTRTKALGFYFANKAAFQGFKNWLQTEWTALKSILPATTNQTFQDFFQNVELKALTESITLRSHDVQNTEDYSFARVFVALLFKYQKNVGSAEFGVLPFDVGELFHPTNLIFVNVEKHSKASSKQISDEWELIQKSIAMKLTILSNAKISKLTTAIRNIQKMSTLAANALTNKDAVIQQAKFIDFKKKQPSTVELAAFIKTILKSMKDVARSENPYKNSKRSFAKQNRRNPDDYNKSGTINHVKYLPDLHIYLDTSGSISEENYKDSIQALMMMAKKLNINLYFNSFSHVLSKETMVQVKNKNLKQIYQTFQKIPKVDGGTDYEQIWHYINLSKTRSARLSLIITDMEYTASNHFVKHPKHLYYVPCSNMDWTRICRYGKKFHDSMLHNDPNIRKHLLF